MKNTTHKENLATNDQNISFNEDYQKWKNWDEAKFSQINDIDRAYFNAEIKRMASSLSRNPIILEIGFGNGKFLQYCKEKKWHPIGIEANQLLVATAIDHGFHAINTTSLSSFKDEQFDLIVAFDVLEHMQHTKIIELLQNIRRILKDDGQFLARFPNADSPFGLMNQNGDVTHITSIGSGKIQYFATVTNFQIYFIGGEAEPIVGVSYLQLTHRFVSVLTKKIMNYFVNLIFYPRRKHPFFSSNMVVVFKK